MGCDTKMFVTCGEDKFLPLMRDVVEALNIYTRDILDTYIKEHTDALNRFHFLRHEDYKAQSKTYSNGVDVRSFQFDSFQMLFGIGEENNRMLFVTPTCSCDYSDVYEGDKVIFSLGCWGLSEEIMMTIVPVLKKYGRVFYDYNDCDDIDFKEV